MKGNNKQIIGRKLWSDYEHLKLVYLCEVEGLIQREAAKRMNGRTHHAVLKRITELKASGQWQRFHETVKATNFKPYTGRGRPKKDKALIKPGPVLKELLEEQLELPLEEVSEPARVTLESSSYALYVTAAFSAGIVLGMAIGHNFL